MDTKLMKGLIEKERICRIAIVEDDFAVADTLRRYILNEEVTGKFGFNVHITENILEAIGMAEKNLVDIFIVDLGLRDPLVNSHYGPSVGARYIPQLATHNNCGIIVFSSEKMNLYYENLLDVGADDYIEKSEGVDNYKHVVKKIVALWRRTVAIKSDVIQLVTGLDRKFSLEEWNFTVGDQVVKSIKGAAIHVGPTEYELIKCLCLAKGMTMNESEIGVFVLKRNDLNSDELKKSIENLVYRVRKKLGSSVVEYLGGGIYKINALEIKNNTNRPIVS